MTIKYIFDKSINDKTMVNTYQSYDLDKSLTDTIVLNIFFDLTSDSANYFLHGVSDDVIRGNLTVTQRKHILSLDNVQAVIDYVLSLSPVSNVPNTGAGETPNDTPKQNPLNGVPVSNDYVVVLLIIQLVLVLVVVNVLMKWGFDMVDFFIQYKTPFLVFTGLYILFRLLFSIRFTVRHSKMKKARGF